ncbi:fungal-specific transcription factor domain-containing protein [Talaromyces proteolyticus]|uniref:Fungal-specific transcription factor domain-containing protein n=1 Tax=Talaromyces proteolyticus TaxID=1131652 RepID=A0AAD4L496_9EURO|nr:fungal-specific transcription factor domain-containing protein [Talaromyces proteolyticus]KAH8705682.1 fungal-specific transcription factor domain-containing protein [Talaromyces proteolyticus]
MAVASGSATDGTPEHDNIIRTHLPSLSTDSITTTSFSVANDAYVNKVAIPRWIRGDKSVNEVNAEVLQRSSRACESCRQRKAKCTKDLPSCRACNDLQVSCYYVDGKIMRTKRELDDITLKAVEYEKLLRDLSTRVDEIDANRIRTTLEKVPICISSDDDLPGPAAVPSSDETGRDGPNNDIDYNWCTDFGSLGAVDCVAEDFNRNERSRASGYIGKGSELHWLQRLRIASGVTSIRPRDFDHPFHHDCDMEPSSTYETLAESYDGLSIVSLNYHLDNVGINVNETIDPYSIPPREYADMLLKAYLTSVHPYFPILGKITFMSQYRRFYDQSGVKPSDKWLAILNMVFAISAKYSYIARVNWVDNDKDHRVYFTRARELSMNGKTLFDHPDLQQVQIEGLIAFYFLTTEQINRSWRVSSIAIRSAIGLGINLSSKSTLTSDISKEVRCRVWWSLYTLEHVLCTMTGRPTCISGDVCLAPLPLPFDEDDFHLPNVSALLSNPVLRQQCITSLTTGLFSCIKQSAMYSPASIPCQTAKDYGARFGSRILESITPNSSLCFLYLTSLTSITQDIISRLYVSHARKPNLDENTITNGAAQVDIWLSNLPGEFNFTIEQTSQVFSKQRLHLACQFYTTRIYLSYPCLFLADRTKQHSTGSFHNRIAILCVESARHVLELILKQPNASEINVLSPWWCLLHVMVQATTVLLQELFFHAVHMPHEIAKIFKLTKKAIHWLLRMSNESSACHRAWELCDACMRHIAPHIGVEVDSLLDVAQNSLTKSSLSGLHNRSSITQMQLDISSSLPDMLYQPLPVQPLQEPNLGDAWIAPEPIQQDEALAYDLAREEIPPYLPNPYDMDL